MTVRFIRRLPLEAPWRSDITSGQALNRLLPPCRLPVALIATQSWQGITAAVWNALNGPRMSANNANKGGQ